MTRADFERILADLCGDAPARQERAEAWLLSHPEESAEPLVEALGEPRWGSTGHWRIMRIAAHVAPETAVPAILGRLRHGCETRDSILVRGAMEALAAIGSTEARQALLEMLDSGNRDYALQAAIHLEDFHAPELIGTFAGMIESPDASLRYIATRALLAFHDPRADALVRRRYAVEPDSDIRKLIESEGRAAQDE